MISELNISVLIKNLQPVLHEGSFVFCAVSEISSTILTKCIMIFKEEESLTLILDKHDADASGMKYDFVVAWITLKVYSSLAETGLTAVFSKVLADEGISCNVVAAYHHDHIFVPLKDAPKAIKVLHKLASSF